MKLLRVLALALLLTATFSATKAHAVAGGAGIVNPISANPIEADGAYGAGEWLDITPAWFHSDSATGATPVAPQALNANSLLFAGLAQESDGPELYLMYDYLPRTVAPTTPGEFLGDVSFPLAINGASRFITVIFTANGTLTGTTISVDLHDGGPLHDGAQFGLEGAAGLGTTPASIVGASSPFATTVHGLLELAVPLNTPAGFGGPNGPFDPAGQGNGNGYSPDPAFWGSNIAKNDSDPPASAGIFSINPDGSTFIVPVTFNTPEPSTLVLGVLGAFGLLLAARKRRAAR